MKFKREFFEQDLKTMTSIDVDFSKLEGKNILITGANGLIASYFIDMLMWLNENKKFSINVYALCRNKEKAELRFEDYLNSNKFEIIEQDVTEYISLDINFDYIIHAASNAHPLAYSENPVGTMKANIIGTINLLEYACKHNNTRFMFISSSEIYGEVKDIDNGNDENYWGSVNSMNVRSCYSESKRAGENICICYKEQYGLDVVVVRPGYIYGPSITQENSRADAQFLRNVLSEQDIVMKSEGRQLRSYCYVADAITALITILLKGENGQAYNIANRNSQASIREFAEILARIGDVSLKFNIPSEVEKKGYSTVTRSILKTDKLESLGWNGKYSLEDGIKRMIDILK